MFKTFGKCRKGSPGIKLQGMGSVFLLGMVSYVVLLPTMAAAQQAPGGRPPSTGNIALETAIETCAGSVAKDERGMPDHKAMDACMKAKGFTPPQGGPPPTGNSALDAAIKTCAGSVAKDERGMPDHKAMDTCIKAKGLSLPQGGPPPMENRAP